MATAPHILLVHNRYQQRGGEDAAVDAEAAMMGARGHAVTPYFESNDRAAAMHPMRAAAQTLWAHDSYRRLSEVIDATRPDVAHFHNTFMMVSPSAYHACGRRRVPVVQTLHNYRLLCPQPNLFRNGSPCQDCVGRRFAWPGVVHACYREDRRASLVVASMAALHRTLGTYEQVDVFVALSEFARTRFLAGGLPAERVVVSHNWVVPDPGFHATPGQYAIFAGRLCEEKGVDILLAAWRDHDLPLPLKIAGAGPLSERVRSTAARHPQIEYLGFIEPQRVAALIAGAALSLTPSRVYENCSMAALESMAVGTPVLAADIGSFRELIEPGDNGELFEPGNPEELAAAVARLLARDLRAVRRAARDHYERRFSEVAGYARLLSIFERAREHRLA